MEEGTKTTISLHSGTIAMLSLSYSAVKSAARPILRAVRCFATIEENTVKTYKGFFLSRR